MKNYINWLRSVEYSKPSLHFSVYGNQFLSFITKMLVMGSEVRFETSAIYSVPIRLINQENFIVFGPMKEE
jgi:hypothetical protein